MKIIISNEKLIKDIVYSIKYVRRNIEKQKAENIEKIVEKLEKIRLDLGLCDIFIKFMNKVFKTKFTYTHDEPITIKTIIPFLKENGDENEINLYKLQASLNIKAYDEARQYWWRTSYKLFDKCLKNKEKLLLDLSMMIEKNSNTKTEINYEDFLLIYK